MRIEANERFGLWIERICTFTKVAFVVAALLLNRFREDIPGFVDNMTMPFMLAVIAIPVGFVLFSFAQIVLAWLKTIHPFGARKKTALHGFQIPRRP